MVKVLQTTQQKYYNSDYYVDQYEDPWYLWISQTPGSYFQKTLKLDYIRFGWQNSKFGMVLKQLLFISW